MFIIIITSLFAFITLWLIFVAIKEREEVFAFIGIVFLSFTIILGYVGIIKQHTYTVIDILEVDKVENYMPIENYKDYYYVIANEEGVVYIVKPTEHMEVGDQFSGSEAYLSMHYEYSDSTHLT